MCYKCDYPELLEAAGLETNPNRLLVMEVIGANNHPLTAADVHLTISRTRSINRVTVYRILDTLAAHRIVERINTGGRAAHYGLGPNKHHAPHPHFYCTGCGALACLTPGSLTVDSDHLHKTFPGEVQRIEVRVEGLCKQCTKQESTGG